MNLCSAGNAYTATAQLVGLVSGTSYRASFNASRHSSTTAEGLFTASVDTTGAPTSQNVVFADLPAVGSGSADVHYALQSLDFTASSTTHTLSIGANSLTNTGVLDIMTWNGALPVDFVNNGIVLDRSAVKIDAFAITGNAFSVTLTAHSGHAYQLQRSETLTGTWQDIGVANQGDDTIITLTDPAAASQPRMFYRVMLNP